MLKLDKTKNKFQKDGFVILKKIFSNKEIKKLIKEIKYIKKKSIKIKNPHLHYTKDKKVNTIHNINKYIILIILKRIISLNKTKLIYAEHK